MEAVAMISNPIEWGVAATPLKGNRESGDTYLVRHFAGGALAAVIDGLGHGSEAAQAAREALATLEQRPAESVIVLLQQCHQQLQGAPRSVVMTLASFNFEDKTLTCAGVGNVEGCLVRADPRAVPRHESVVPRRGLVGGRLPSLRASSHSLTPGDSLVLATDGIRPGFEAELKREGAPQEIADAILRQHNLGTDDALVLVVRYLGAHA
jgi:serine phosphatase RsbU (regulator of sigma subunit)